MHMDLPLDNKTVWATGPPGRGGPWTAGRPGHWPAFSKTRSDYSPSSQHEEYVCAICDWRIMAHKRQQHVDQEKEEEGHIPENHRRP